ncbi:hypothetical protein [Kribbella italica]|uniref:LPXTG cell wall anchor domain-containing protein n=1 Tax=Kribbella italica TaxID=1540520 RepID=A0A7W9J7M9_9ACTN|nr:hypothetical protein [Kribbella italica]MBB5836592.1 hypothetical protein [Kribbella italica]
MESEPTDGSSAGSCLSIGCFATIGAAIVGLVTWLIVDHYTPCYCEGDSDAAWFESMDSTPYGLLAFVATLALVAFVVIRRRR